MPVGSTVSTLLFGVVIVAALYIGRDVFVPIALAILLSFVLAPLVRFLQSWRVPRGVSVVLVVIVSFVAILGIGGVMVAQMNQLAEDLPRYQSTLREKIQSLRGVTGGGTLDKAADVLMDLGKELDTPKSGAKAGSQRAPSQAAERPVPVEIRQPDPGALQTVVTLITPLVHPLTTTGIVFIFVIFVLLQREDLRSRLIRLGGVRDLQRTTAAIDDAGRRLSRLFLAQLGLNAVFGLIVGAGLYVIGVPSAPLWGIMAMILRFVPYIAAAVGSGWDMVLWTAALFAVVEPLVGHVIEPLVLGHSSGLSPVAVIASATFWTWLWGPIGLVLATPLTICLVVAGRHVDRLKFLDVMFGNEPALTPSELVYQRLLAGDPVEAAEQAQLYLKDKSLADFYQDIFLESLKLAQTDAARGELDDERILRIRETAAEIIDDLGEHREKPLLKIIKESDRAGGLATLKEAEARSDEAAPVAVPHAWLGAEPVLCIPGHGPFDETLAAITAQLLQRQGLGARAEAADALSVARIFALDTEGAGLASLCYLGSATPAQIRYVVRRLRRKLPDAPIVVMLLEAQDAAADEDLNALPDNTVVRTSLSTTIEEIIASARRSAQEK